MKNAARRGKEIKEATITKIGNKYFEVDISWDERIKITSELREYFGQYGRLNLDLDQLKRIKSIIEE